MHGTVNGFDIKQDGINFEITVSMTVKGLTEMISYAPPTVDAKNLPQTTSKSPATKTVGQKMAAAMKSYNIVY